MISKDVRQERGSWDFTRDEQIRRTNNDYFLLRSAYANPIQFINIQCFNLLVFFQPSVDVCVFWRTLSAFQGEKKKKKNINTFSLL